MIACLDVLYEDRPARGACVLNEDWTAPTPAEEFVETFDQVEPYVPGEFYRREMPCLLSMLLRKEPTDRLTAVVVDGFVWLGDESTPGLGGHLYRGLGDSVPVVGVAKSWMRMAAARVDDRCTSAPPGSISTRRADTSRGCTGTFVCR